jgi:hypothetical protein
MSENFWNYYFYDHGRDFFENGLRQSFNDAMVENGYWQNSDDEEDDRYERNMQQSTLRARMHYLALKHQANLSHDDDDEEVESADDEDESNIFTDYEIENFWKLQDANVVNDDENSQ